MFHSRTRNPGKTEREGYVHAIAVSTSIVFLCFLFVLLILVKKDYLNEIEVSFRMKYIAQGNFIILFCYSFNFMLNGFMMEWHISPHFFSLRLGKQWSRRAHIFVKRRYKVSFHNRNSQGLKIGDDKSTSLLRKRTHRLSFIISCTLLCFIFKILRIC